MIRHAAAFTGLAVALAVLASCRNGPSVGSRAPAFSAHDDRGAEVSLADFEGKVVVLDFWATWCGPCVKASPYVQELYERYAGNEDVVVLGVHYDDRGDPLEYVAEHGYTYPVIPDGSGVVEAYGIIGIPTFLVIDRRGTVVHKQVGFYGPEDVRKLAEVVEEHLQS